LGSLLHPFTNDANDFDVPFSRPVVAEHPATNVQT
jgi:hypothetical protein